MMMGRGKTAERAEKKKERSNLQLGLTIKVNVVE